MVPKLGKLNDCICEEEKPVLCENVGKVSLNLRGLCPDTILDTSFFLQSGTINGKRYFRGNFGWKLFWDPEENGWKITSPVRKGVYAIHTQNSMYPLGLQNWNIVNDKKCVYNDETVLNLSDCNEDEFTCDNGVCIAMEKRCDQRSDCQDVSDEKNCQMVNIDRSNYLASKPPPPLHGDTLVTVEIRIDFMEVLEILEVDQIFRSKYTLYLEWVDPRIEYFNLQINKKLNNLIPKEKEQIWVPRLIFWNTEKHENSVNDVKAEVGVSRKGNFTRSPRNEIKNIFKFKGAENPLTLERVYETSWICK